MSPEEAGTFAQVPPDYVLFDWARNSALSNGHVLGDWEQDGELAVAKCTRCDRVAIVDFSAAAADRDAEVDGTAVHEVCDSS
jgi:hypothetical protein